MLNEKLLGKSKGGLSKIEEGQDSEDDREEAMDVVPAMIIGASRKQKEKEASLDQEQAEITKMYDEMFDMLKRTSEDLESRFESEESKVTLEKKGAISTKTKSVMSSAHKFTANSQATSQYQAETPISTRQSKAFERMSKNEDKRLDKIASEASQFLKQNNKAKPMQGIGQMASDGSVPLGVKGMSRASASTYSGSTSKTSLQQKIN